MAEEQYQDQVSYEIALKIRDLEINQKLMRDRILLISQNFIDSQEKDNEDIIELKKQLIETKDDLKRLKSIIIGVSEEISKTARKEELNILKRQFKMFEPLGHVRIEDIDKIVDEKINKHKKHNKTEQEPNPHQFWVGKT